MTKIATVSHETPVFLLPTGPLLAVLSLLATEVAPLGIKFRLRLDL